MATCPACGKDYTPPAAFCPNCNAVLDKPDTQGQPTLMLAPGAEPRFGDIGVYIVRRFLALVVDIAGVGLLMAIGALALAERVNLNIHPETPTGYRTFVLLVLVLLFIYYWIFEGLVGTTLGKLLFGLGITRDDGRGIGLGRALVRNILRPIDLAVIGFVLAAVTPRRKRLGDMLAGSVVSTHRIGALAPLLAVIVLGGIGYLAYAYGHALDRARALYDSSQEFAPTMFQQQQPAPTVSPLPALTATPIPITSATPPAAPSATPSASPASAESPSPASST